MIRLISIEKYDILTDPEETAEILNRAVSRKLPMRFSGLCDTGSETLTVVLEETEETQETEFIFSPFESACSEEMAAVIEHRYLSGYSTLAAFPIGEQVWGLFAKEL